MPLRLLAFLIGVVLAVATVRHLQRSAQPLSPVLSENSGTILEVEFHYTSAAAATTWPALSAFFQALDPDVEVVAVCGDTQEEHALLRRWIFRQPLRTVVADSAISAWSKDRFLVRAGRFSTLVHPRPDRSPTKERTNDAAVAGLLARRWPDRYAVEESSLEFDAGDILCTGRFAIFSQVLQSKNPSVNNLSIQVARMTGHEPVQLHEAPTHHIGMFAAPVGEKTVVVGDPDWGRRLWSTRAEQRLGKPDFHGPATQPFHNVSKEFDQMGYKVVRAPTVVMGPQVYVSYTNGVFEERDGAKIVYMPFYGVPELDDAARRTYLDLGWEVRPVPVVPLFRFRGTIGCLVNILRRDRS